MNEAGVGEGDGDWTRELGSDAEKGRATRLWEPDQRGSWVCCITVAFVLLLASGVFCGLPDQPPLLTPRLTLQLTAAKVLLLLLLFALCDEPVLE